MNRDKKRSKSARKRRAGSNYGVSDKNTGGSNIFVAVRVRPINDKETYISNFETAKVIDNNTVLLLDPQYEMAPEDHFRNHRNRQKQYDFDIVFNQSTSQKSVFENTTQTLVANLLKGYNATTFAYGATGAGKTYTMLGSPSKPGVVPNTLQNLYGLVESQPKGKIQIRVSYIEVYNEILRDLLTSDDTNLEIREEPGVGITISGIKEIVANSKTEVMTMLKVGNRNRMKESTMANEVSSRSHAVFLLTVEVKDEEKDEIVRARLSMIDLAGSERAAYTNNKGMRMREGANINKSLLALGNCINALVDNKRSKGRRVYVPYRDSKLTRLLKDSLGGNCRTIMIANISPAVTCYEDTLNTLKYAHRARSIRTSTKKNVKEAVKESVEGYTDMIRQLQEENKQLKKAIRDQNLNGSQDMSEDMGDLSKDQRNQMQELEKKILTHFQEEGESLTKYYIAEDNLENMKQNLAKTLGDVDEATKGYIVNLQNQKETLRLDSKKIEEKRQTLLDEIQKIDRDNFIFSFCMSLYEKEEIKIQNKKVKRKENQHDNVLRYRDWAIKFLKNQVQMRDNVLFEHKMIIDRNNLDNSITYRGLKQVDNIAENAPKIGNDLSFPSIKKKRGGSQMATGRYSKRGRNYSSYAQAARAGRNSYQTLPRIPSNYGRKPYYSRKQNNNKTHDLPDYLKQRIIYQKRANSSMQQGTLKDKSLSYQRRLQKAIFDRDTKYRYRKPNMSRRGSQVSSFGNPGLTKRKVGLNYRSQPNLKLMSKRLPYRNIGQSPFVQEFIKKGRDGNSNSRSASRGRVGSALRLLKRKQ